MISFPICLIPSCHLGALSLFLLICLHLILPACDRTGQHRKHVYGTDRAGLNFRCTAEFRKTIRFTGATDQSRFPPAILHEAFELTPLILLLDGITFVVSFLALAEAEKNLGLAVLEV